MGRVQGVVRTVPSGGGRVQGVIRTPPGGAEGEFRWGNRSEKSLLEANENVAKRGGAGVAGCPPLGSLQGKSRVKFLQSR